jgi:choline dehydrogenase
MLPQLAVFSGLVIGAISHPTLSRYARVIDERALTSETTYDFVIAGGGIAGLTVADRLTENPDGTSQPNTNVLLLIARLKSPYL